MPYTFKPVLNSKPKQNGTYAILIRITLDRQRKSVNTGEAVKKSEFNAKKGKVRASNDFHESINNSISDKIKAAEEKARQNPGITLEQMQLFIQGKEVQEGPRFLMDIASELIAIYYKDDAIMTRYYKNSIGYWETFEKHTGKQFLPSEVSIKTLKEYEQYLTAKSKSKSQNTRAKHLTRLRRIYKLAVANGMVEYKDNPFNNYELKHGKAGKKERLSLEEIKDLEEQEIPESSPVFHARNIWLAQMYCAGTRIGDMITMRVGNIMNGRLVFEMEKTEKDQSIQIPKKALSIFGRYTKGKKPGDYIFPYFSTETDYSDRDFFVKQIQSKTTTINKHLKKLATMAGIDKNLTTHVARHTFADMARQKSKDVYAVSKALRHSSTKITESYLASFDNDAVDDVMSSVFGDE
jgi:site-specific recombinase XerD